MKVYRTIIVVNGEVRGRVEQDKGEALEYARHVARWYLGIDSNTQDADALQERIIDDERVAYADVAVEEVLY